MHEIGSLESDILKELARVDACTLDELTERLSYYSWKRVFSAVERLTREGTVALKHPAPFLCFLSLPSRRSSEVRQVTPV